MDLLVLIGALWTLVITILWLVTGWRAMKAHERLADSADEIRHAVRAYAKIAALYPWKTRGALQQLAQYGDDCVARG